MSSNSLNMFENEMCIMKEQLLLITNKVKHMEKVIETQREKIEQNNIVIYNLINGLFNHSNQSRTIIEYTEMIFGELSEEEKEPHVSLTNQNKWNNYPTTRQGDENEKRIEQLETKLNTILEIIQEETSEPQENEEDIQTDICYSVVSDHSSIPYLIECSETVSNMTDELEDEDNLSF